MVKVRYCEWMGANGGSGSEGAFCLVMSGDLGLLITRRSERELFEYGGYTRTTSFGVQEWWRWTGFGAVEQAVKEEEEV